MSNSFWASANSTADLWFGYMVASLLDASLGLLLVSVVILLVRRRVPPRWCYLLFLIVPLKLLVPISLPLVPGLASAATKPIPASDSTSVELLSAQPDPTMGTYGPANERYKRSVRMNTAGNDEPTVLSRLVAPSIKAILMIAWVAIVVSLLLRFAHNQRKLSRMLAQAVPVASSSLSQRGIDFAAIRNQLRVGRRVAILASDDIYVPAVVGVWKSKVVLPSALLRELGPRQLSCVLGHELAHVKWYDLPAAMLERLVRIVHFANPALWIAGHLTHTWREHACDDAALLVAGADRRMVGSTLLKVLEFAQRQSPTAAPAIALFERTRFHQQRLHRIMTAPHMNRRATVGSVILLVAAAAALLPNLRAARPTAPTATATITEQAGPQHDDGDPKLQEFPAREPITVVDERPLVEQQHDIKKLLQMGTDPYRLGELIKNSVLLTSWRSVGGPGELSIDTGTSTLQVKNVASAQQAIHRLVETFELILNSRAAQDAQKPAPTTRSFPIIVEHAGQPFEQTVTIYHVPSLLYVDDSQRDPGLADFDSLIRLITSVVAPDSWDSVGGPARIDAWPAGEALVVAATRKTHAEIMALCTVLESFPPIGVSRLPSPAAPIEVQLPLGTPFVNMAAANLITKLYPVHDLLPLETQPAFWVSPRATGLEQLCDRIVTIASPTNNHPVCIRTFRNRATVLLAATEETHTKVSDALSDARRRKQTATTQEQQIALDQELFPPVYQDRDGYYPGSAVPMRVYLYGTCNADEQLTKLTPLSERIDSAHLIATDVTNDGLANVGRFTNLRQLICWSKGIDDAGIARLRNLQLTHLVLRGKQITDNCVESLAAIKHPWMSRFDLSHTSITDKGLLRLVELNLRWLNVSHTGVTAAGVERVRSEYPDAYIIFEQ